jgi:hypothetical protein
MTNNQHNRALKEKEGQGGGPEGERKEREKKKDRWVPAKADATE